MILLKVFLCANVGNRFPITLQLYSETELDILSINWSYICNNDIALIIQPGNVAFNCYLIALNQHAENPDSEPSQLFATP